MSLDWFNYYREVLEFVLDVKSLYPDKFDWVGVYFKESFILSDDSKTDLLLGPFIGEKTQHTRIPLESGLCGLALREERIVNMDDVTKDTRHIACSLTTRSELIIPISDNNGNFFAELDIDSNTPSAFSSEIEKRVKDFCQNFPLKNF